MEFLYFLFFLLGIHRHRIVIVVFLGCLEILVVIIFVVVNHFVRLRSREVDLGATGAAAALDDVGRVDLGEIVL